MNSSKRQTPLPSLTRPFTSFIQMRRQTLGEFRLFQSHLIVSKAAKLCRKLGEASGMMNFQKSRALMVVYLSMHLGSQEVRQRVIVAVDG